MEQIEKHVSKRDLHKGVIVESPASPESKIFSLGSTKIVDPWYSNEIFASTGLVVTFGGLIGTVLLLRDTAFILSFFSIGAPAAIAAVSTFFVLSSKQRKREIAITQKLAHQQVEALSQWLKVRYGIVVEDDFVRGIILQTLLHKDIINFKDTNGKEYFLTYGNDGDKVGYSLSQKAASMTTPLSADTLESCWESTSSELQKEILALKQNIRLLEDEKLTPEQQIRVERVRNNYAELMNTINRLVKLGSTNQKEYIHAHNVLNKLVLESSQVLTEIRSSLTKQLEIQEEYLISALPGQALQVKEL